MTNPAFKELFPTILGRGAVGGAAGAGVGALAAGPDERLEGALAGGLLGAGLGGASPYMHFVPAEMPRTMPRRPAGAVAPRPLPAPPMGELSQPPADKLVQAVLSGPETPAAKPFMTAAPPAAAAPVPAAAAAPVPVAEATPEAPGLLERAAALFKGKKGKKDAPTPVASAAPTPAQIEANKAERAAALEKKKRLKAGNQPQPEAATVPQAEVAAAPKKKPKKGAQQKAAFDLAYEAAMQKHASTMLDPHSQQPAALNAKENKKRFKAMLPKGHKKESSYAETAFEEGAHAALTQLGLEKTAFVGALMTGARAMAPAAMKAGRGLLAAGKNVGQAGRAMWQGGAPAAAPYIARAGNALRGVGAQVSRGAQAGWQAAKPGFQAFGQKLKSFAPSSQAGAAQSGTLNAALGQTTKSAEVSPETLGRFRNMVATPGLLGGGAGLVAGMAMPEDEDERVRSALRQAIRMGTAAPGAFTGATLGSHLTRGSASPWAIVPEVGGAAVGGLAGLRAGNTIADTLVPLE